MLPKSKYIGVFWAKTSKKWCAIICHNYKKIHIGVFENEVEAAKAYDEYAKKLRGKKAILNFGDNVHECEAPNCKNKAVTCFQDKWVCVKHKSQLVAHGKFLTRTIFDKNEIIIDGDYSYIILYNKNSEEVARAKIDTYNVEIIKDYKWYLRPDGYVATVNYNGEYAYLHSVILHKENKPYIDHVDRDKLNNTESNLREANGTENNRNKGLTKRNTSGKTGVSWSKEREKWIAYIRYGGKNRNLGGFVNFDDAVACRIAAEKKYYGEFRPETN